MLQREANCLVLQEQLKLNWWVDLAAKKKHGNKTVLEQKDTERHLHKNISLKLSHQLQMYSNSWKHQLIKLIWVSN